MADTDLDQLQTAIQRHWSRIPSKKAQPYVNAFSARVRSGTKITAKVVGNHGTYTVSIQLDTQGLTSACSCYIGKHGYCHHCEALALTFLAAPSLLKVVTPKQAKDVRDLTDVRSYLDSVTLEALLTQPKDKGITQKAFAVNRAYFALFQAAICALERRGIRRREWTHKGVHSDFVQLFVRRQKLVPASFAGSLPSVRHLRRIADYQQPGVSPVQAERAVRCAREFVTRLQREVFDGPQTDHS